MSSCDFENVALGVRDAKYAAFDIQKVLERLLSDPISWSRRPTAGTATNIFKAAMHEAAFELIEIPLRAPVGQELGGYPHGCRCPGPLLHQVHVGQLRGIISGDSDFSPLVRRGKLRENNKMPSGWG